jgi:hypothetical protein
MLTAIIVTLVLFLLFDLYQRFYKPKVGTRAWPELAVRIGMTYKPPTGPWSNRSPPHVAGIYRGYDLKLDLARVAHGVVDDGIALYRTRVVLSPKRKINGYVILKRKWYFWSHGVEVGDEQFDRRLVVDSRPEDLITQIFASPELRQRLLQTYLLTFKVSDLGLLFEKAGVENNIERLQSLFDLVCDIAEVTEQVV